MAAHDFGDAAALWTPLGALAALAINLGARFRSLALSLAGCVALSAVAVMGALALALALAFGLGGRDVASRMLEDAYSKGQTAKGQAKQDLARGKDRAQEQVGSAGGSTRSADGSTAGTGSDWSTSPTRPY